MKRKRDVEPTIPPGNFWRVRVGPVQSQLIAEHAPLLQLVVQNHGPGEVEIMCTTETVILQPGRLWVALARDKIALSSHDLAHVDMQFLPRQRAY